MNQLVRISPEGFDIANAYLMYGTVEETANQLQVPRHEVVKVLQTSEVKKYLDGVYLDMGYRNRDKLGQVLDRMIEAKLEEAMESGVYTGKDLLDLLQFAHKMRMDEIKANKDAPEHNTNVQIANFGGEAYGKLMERLLKPRE